MHKYLWGGVYCDCYCPWPGRYKLCIRAFVPTTINNPLHAVFTCVCLLLSIKAVAPKDELDSTSSSVTNTSSDCFLRCMTDSRSFMTRLRAHHRSTRTRRVPLCPQCREIRPHTAGFRQFHLFRHRCRFPRSGAAQLRDRRLMILRETARLAARTGRIATAVNATQGCLSSCHPGRRWPSVDQGRSGRE